jgi:hypothetical protein
MTQSEFKQDLRTLAIITLVFLCAALMVEIIKFVL